MKLIKLRWGEEDIRGFSKPVKKAEVTDDWVWWALFGATVIMVILVILKMSGRI